VRLPTDINTLRFRLPSNNRKQLVFRGVDELIDKRPLCVKAIGVSVSEILPVAMLKVGWIQLVNYVFLPICAKYARIVKCICA